jgi:hypothetical protein
MNADFSAVNLRSSAKSVAKKLLTLCLTDVRAYRYAQESGSIMTRRIQPQNTRLREARHGILIMVIDIRREAHYGKFRRITMEVSRRACGAWQ